jgi:hypothetical protein
VNAPIAYKSLFLGQLKAVLFNIFVIAWILQDSGIKQLSRQGKGAYILNGRMLSE